MAGRDSRRSAAGLAQLRADPGARALGRGYHRPCRCSPRPGARAARDGDDDVSDGLCSTRGGSARRALRGADRARRFAASELSCRCAGQERGAFVRGDRRRRLCLARRPARFGRSINAFFTIGGQVTRIGRIVRGDPEIRVVSNGRPLALPERLGHEHRPSALPQRHLPLHRRAPLRTWLIALSGLASGMTLAFLIY